MSAGESREGTLTGAVLRCYPARWRRRHAGEAAEMAALLIADGTPAASIAWSHLLGAAREWLAPRPGRSLSTAVARCWPPRQFTPCRPVLPGPGAGALPAAGRLRLSIQEAAHARSC